MKILRNLTYSAIALLSLTALATHAFAIDSVLCGDDDNDGIVTIFKTIGSPDRDCDGELSVLDGGTDCNDLDPNIKNTTYSNDTCASNEYHYCEGGVYKTGPGGSTIANGCTSTVLAERVNNYYFSPSGSGTACTFGSPCNISALTNGGAVTIIAPAALYLVGTGDITGSGNFLTLVSGQSSILKNILRKYPTAATTARWNTSSGCTAPCSTVKIQADNWQIFGIQVAGGDPNSSGGLRLEGDNIEAAYNWINGVVGQNNNNLAGIYLKDGAVNPWVHHNSVGNTHDPSLTSPSATRQNVWNIGGFATDNGIIEYNRVGYNHAPNTVPYAVQGGGIRYKHGELPGAIAARSDTRKNIIYNCENGGTIMEADKKWVYGNLLVGNSICGADVVSSNGNFTYFTDRRWFNNTCVGGIHYNIAINTGQAYNILGNSGGQIIDGYVSGGMRVYGNVINDSAQTTYGGGNFLGIFGIQPYGPDTNYDAMITNRCLESDYNCFFNASIPTLASGFPIFADNGSSSFGGTVNFTGWKAPPYSQDINSANGNMSLDANMNYTAVCPASIGWAEEWPTPAVIISTPTRGIGVSKWKGF